MTKSTHEQTADSYDAHIIPAETAARKEREGDNYKQVPDDSKNPGSHTTSGCTVDGEGLENNYAVEPQIYVDKPGDLGDHLSLVTVVDIFPTQVDAEKAVLAMQNSGLTANKISIIAKDYQGAYHDGHGALTWQNITDHGGLAFVLKGLGIAENKTSPYTTAVDDGKFLVVVTGSDRDASKAQHILQSLGHELIAH